MSHDAHTEQTGKQGYTPYITYVHKRQYPQYRHRNTIYPCFVGVQAVSAGHDLEIILRVFFSRECFYFHSQVLGAPVVQDYAKKIADSMNWRRSQFTFTNRPLNSRFYVNQRAVESPGELHGVGCGQVSYFCTYVYTASMAAEMPKCSSSYRSFGFCSIQSIEQGNVPVGFYHGAEYYSAVFIRKKRCSVGYLVRTEAYLRYLPYTASPVAW